MKTVEGQTQEVRTPSNGRATDGAGTARVTVPNRTVPNPTNKSPGEAAVRTGGTAGASRPGAVSSTSNGNGSGHRPELCPADCDEWNTAAEAMRRRGWGEDSVRRVLHWGLSQGPKGNLDLFLLRVVAVVFEVQDKARQQRPKIQDQAAFAIGWLKSLGEDPSREPSDRAQADARKALDMVRDREPGSTRVKDLVASVLRAWEMPAPAEVSA